MIYFKNRKSGFTLIETMLAMVIIGLALAPVFLLLGTITKRMNKSSKQVYAFLWAQQLLYEARQKQEPDASEFVLEKKIEEQDITLKYTLQKGFDQKSPLASYEGLHKELISITWSEMGKQHTEQFLSYVYKRPEQKKS